MHVSSWTAGRQCRTKGLWIWSTIFLSSTLAPKESYGHRPLITDLPPCPDSYRECAAMTVLALAEPFIAAGAAVAFWFFFATEKELSPRGYERNEIIYSWWKTPTLGNWIQIRRLLRRASSQWQKRCLIAITRKIPHRYDKKDTSSLWQS